MINELAYFGGKKAVTIESYDNWPILTDKDKQYLKDFVEKNIISCYGKGKEIINKVEKKLSEYTGSKYCIFVNSGTAALLLAFYALSIREGDEIIVPAYTYPATITPLIHFGCKIVLADIEEDSLNISSKDIVSKITKNTKAIVVTHMRGLPVDLDNIKKVAQKYNLYLIEDCSHAIGSTYNEVHVGNFGDIGCFSLSSDKMLSGGSAGFLITNSNDLFENSYSVVNGPGREDGIDLNYSPIKSEINKYVMEMGIGMNFKSSPLVAELVYTQLNSINKRIEDRKKSLAFLSEILKNKKGIKPPKEKVNCTRGGWYGYRPTYMKEELKMLKKDKFIEILQAEGVKISISSIKPFYKYNVFNSKKAQLKASFNRMDNMFEINNKQKFPNTEKIIECLLKINIDTSKNSCNLYEQYGNAIDKVYNNLNYLPSDFFE